MANLFPETETQSIPNIQITPLPIQSSTFCSKSSGTSCTSLKDVKIEENDMNLNN
jgi:hypothetical protein